MKTSYSVPLVKRIFRWFLRPIFRLVFRILCTVKIEGLDNIPESGPYLVAMNHVSIYEPPLILSFWSCPMEVVSAVEVWGRAGQSLLVEMYGGIQVHRGQFDRRVIEQMIAATSTGHPLLIAPEGGRTHTPAMRRGLPGVAYIAHKMNLEVIPVAISGTSDDLISRIQASFFGRQPRVCLEMHIGKSLRLPQVLGSGEKRRQKLQENADLIMVHIGALLPEPYYGEYASQIRDFLHEV